MSETVSIESLKSEMIGLNSEIDRLNRELAQTNCEKNQSAQYGLVLLDEKYELQQKYDELKCSFETTKNDLDNLRDAFNKSQTMQKVSTNNNIEQEVRLLQENAKKEATFATTLHELQRELKQVRHDLKRVKSEKERLLQDKTELSKQTEVMEWDRKNLRSQLKELKLRESRLFTDNKRLEEENISIRKQVSTLKSSQIHFETLKNEVKRLTEEVETLQAQHEEVEHLRRIAERQLEEALQALQSKRDQKYALKKEFDKRINSESILKLCCFAGFAGLKFGNHMKNDRTVPFVKNYPILYKLEVDLLQTISDFTILSPYY